MEGSVGEGGGSHHAQGRAKKIRSLNERRETGRGESHTASPQFLRKRGTRKRKQGVALEIVRRQGAVSEKFTKNV